MLPLGNLDITIDNIYTELLKKLTYEAKITDVSKYLLSETENDKRVLYVYDLIESYKLNPIITKVNKCENVSKHYRNLGNESYQRQDNYAAWQYYNLALMYAPVPSECYNLAISNRSAVFFSMKEYKACLNDIKVIFSTPFPDHLRDKLVKRQSLCKEALTDVETPDIHVEAQIEDLLKFKGPKGERYLSASTKLQVKYSEELGRHVVARSFIDVGEIIVQEDPFVTLLLKSQYVFCCAYCLSRKLNMYPCSFCCLSMYCSKQCMRDAWQEYHMYECPLMAGLVKMNFTKLELLALRTTIKARTEYKNWKSVLKHVAIAESSVYHNHWGHVESRKGYIYDSKYYPSIHTLATNIEKRDVSDIFQKAVSAAVLMYCLAVANYIKADENPDLKEKIKRFTASTLFTHIMTAPTNMHGISTNVENEDGNFVEEYSIGSGAYAFLSLINHSCAPNVVRYSRLGSAQMSLIAIRPIRKGMEILDNYGYDEVIRDEEDTKWLCALLCQPGAEGLYARLAEPGHPKEKVHHAVHTKEERQAILKSQYKFTCLCEACIENWPLYQNLKTIPSLPADVNSKINICLNGDAIEALQKGDKKRALKLYKILCELGKALEPYVPCKEVAECQEAMKQCLAIFEGVLPKGCNKFVEWAVSPPENIGGPESVTRFYTGHGAKDLK